MEPLVSILIPAFNAEPWLADTIRSAITQTWPRKEIVVVNDGSTDRTLDVARRFEPPGSGWCRRPIRAPPQRETTR